MGFDNGSFPVVPVFLLDASENSAMVATVDAVEALNRHMPMQVLPVLRRVCLGRLGEQPVLSRAARRCHAARIRPSKVSLL